MVGKNGVRELRVEILCHTDLKLVRISTPVGISRRTLSSGQKRSLAHGRSLTVSEGAWLALAAGAQPSPGGGTAKAKVMWHLDPVYICGLETRLAMRLEAQAVQLCCKAGLTVPGSSVDRRLLVNSGAARRIAQNGHVS